MAYKGTAECFDTGKVLIGCKYDPGFDKHVMTQESHFLQKLLLNKGRDADKADRIVLIGMLAIAVLLPLAAYVFNWKLGG